MHCFVLPWPTPSRSSGGGKRTGKTCLHRPRSRQRTNCPHTKPQPTPTTRSAKPLEAGTAADLDRRTMDKLRKGRVRPDARIDLHGMTASRAQSAMNGFLENAHSAGKRCVLVITGKGSLKEGGGVIRRELPAWLNASENRMRILASHRRSPATAGGAFYVLLKRRR